jgi:hypothetical protein
MGVHHSTSCSYEVRKIFPNASIFQGRLFFTKANIPSHKADVTQQHEQEHSKTIDDGRNVK